jgi:hypothetical protein
MNLIEVDLGCRPNTTSSTFLMCYRCHRRRWRYITGWSRPSMTTYCFADRDAIGQWYVLAVVRELTHRPWAIVLESRFHHDALLPLFATAASEARERGRSLPRALLVLWANAWRLTQRNPLMTHEFWRSGALIWAGLDTRNAKPQPSG